MSDASPEKDTRGIGRIGILGGGQLALMLSQPAHSMGFKIKTLVKSRDDALPGPDWDIAEGNWDDPDTARNFAQSVDCVTLENEFVDQAALAAIEESGIPLVPVMRSVSLIQDKWHQKQAMMDARIPVVACTAVSSADDVVRFAGKHGWPVVLKRRHFGYDGKGNATIRSAAELAEAWNTLAVNDHGLYVEAYCPFEREVAVIVCRSINGETALYPAVDTVQKDHICHTVTAPSSLDPERAAEIQDLARRAVEAIHGQGSMGVELFITDDDKVLVNELAPRVHNTGHYTIEACACSQFENHIRAITGMPLGSTEMVRPYAVMVNLLGCGPGPGVPAGLDQARRVEGAHIHIYGKAESRKGRKMGHVTALGDTREEAERIALEAAGLLRFG